MKEVFACAEDTEIDVPMIWQYLVQVISPMIQVDGALPLNFFHRATESVRLSRKMSQLIADVLHSTASQLVRPLIYAAYFSNFTASQWSSTSTSDYGA